MGATVRPPLCNVSFKELSALFHRKKPRTPQRLPLHHTTLLPFKWNRTNANKAALVSPQTSSLMKFSIGAYAHRTDAPRGYTTVGARNRPSPVDFTVPTKNHHTAARRSRWRFNHHTRGRPEQGQVKFTRSGGTGDGWTDGWTNGRMDGWMRNGSYLPLPA